MGSMSRHRGGFTLIELLVVVAIIALLLAIATPSFTRAKEATVRAMCRTNTKTIHTACIAYASQWRQAYPYRPSGNFLPHVMWQSGSFDLNVSFINKYVANRERVMFCPGRLIQARSPRAAGWTGPGGYGYRYVTYTYFNYHPTANLLVEAFPDLSTTVSGQGKYPLWGCLTVDKHWAYLAHDIPQTPAIPQGMNAVRVDGSAAWVEWQDMEPFWTQSDQQEFWWPISGGAE